MIGWLVARGLPRPVAIGGAVALAALACFGIWRCAVDSAADNKLQRGRADTIERAREADQQSATQGRQDDERNRAERGQLEGVGNAPAAPLSDRDRDYLRCVRLQQRARAAGYPSPACR